MLVTQLDANSMERGLVAAPGTVPTFGAAGVAGAYTRPLFSSTSAASDRIYTVKSP